MTMIREVAIQVIDRHGPPGAWQATTQNSRSRSRGHEVHKSDDSTHQLSNREARMALKDILVFLDVSPASEGRLRLATRVARDHGASLSAVFASNDLAADFPPGLGVPRR